MTDIGVGPGRGWDGQPLVLHVLGCPVPAILACARSRTLVHITAGLCRAFHGAGVWYDGRPYLGAWMWVDALGRDVEVWAGRGLRADMEVGADLAAALGIL